MAKLEELTKSLIAHKLITSTTGSLSDRAKRKMEKAGGEAYCILKNRKNKIANIEEMKIGLRWSDEATQWIRAISLALEEFKQTNPNAYEQLEEIRKKHKISRRAYLEFEGTLPGEYYIQVIRSIVKNINNQQARQIYRASLILEKAFGKEKGINRFTLPE